MSTPDPAAMMAAIGQRRAYIAKRAKALSAATELFSPEAMRDACAMVESALGELERRLAARSRAWLLGERVTMADLFWGIELMRMRDVGVAGYREAGRLPEVERYAAATEALPAIRRAVTDWPGSRFQANSAGAKPIAEMRYIWCSTPARALTLQRWRRSGSLTSGRRA